TEKNIDDIYHLAYATVNGLDILLSWNLRHLVKRRTQLIVELTNKALGYRELEIWTPEELMEDDI
ncbi:MAG: PIN domain nuclease, partial [bacterium]